MDQASFTEIAGTAFAVDLGVTTPSIPVEQTINGVPVAPETDPTPDPELDPHSVELVADFIRFSAPLPQAATSQAMRDTLETGEELFHMIGCAECHVPTMQTGPIITQGSALFPCGTF
ncbi:MAG: hypothetical protein IH876_16635 [Gemmatimonadetes bacterium]|nr:hypothetical protein [Gemmatimonadota bacterium]